MIIGNVDIGSVLCWLGNDDYCVAVLLHFCGDTFCSVLTTKEQPVRKEGILVLLLIRKLLTPPIADRCPVVYSEYCVASAIQYAILNNCDTCLKH